MLSLNVLLIILALLVSMADVAFLELTPIALKVIILDVLDSLSVTTMVL